MSGVMFAIFDQESDYCAPCFREYQDGFKCQFTNKMLSIPVVEDETLLFTLQLECDSKENEQGSPKSKLGNKMVDALQRTKTKQLSGMQTKLSFKMSQTSRSRQ